MRASATKATQTRLGTIAALAGLVVLALYQLGNASIAIDRSEPSAPLRTIVAALPKRLSDQSLPFEVVAAFKATAAVERLDHALTPTSLTAARQAIERLPVGDERLALAARLAAVQGDQEAVLTDALASDDYTLFSATVARIASQGRLEEAVQWQRRAIARLRGLSTQREALAQAYLDLGHDENTEAYTMPNAQRHWRAALAAFRSALALRPLSGQVLLFTGYDALQVRAFDEAVADFTRAREVDPSNASAVVGLARVALAQHDERVANADLRIAERLAPQQDDVRQLAHDLARE